MKNSLIFSRQVIVYGVGHILARSISFLLLPFYSHYFLPEEFGGMTLIYTFLGFMNVIVPLGLGSAMMRYYIPANKDDRKTVLSNVYSAAIISSFCFFILSLFFYETINETIIFGPALNNRIIWLVSFILTLDCMWSINLALLRAHNRSVYFVITNLINVVIVVICNILFVMTFDLGVEGVLMSNFIASFVSFMATVSIVFEKNFSFSLISKNIIKKLFTFALPMLATGILSMIIELSDRSIISYILQDAAEVGLYSINYKIGMFMLLVVMGFNMAWQPYFLDSQNKQSLGFITENAIYIGGLLWAIVSIVVPYIITYEIWGFSIIDKIYWNGIHVIPTIALGYFFHGIYVLSVPGMYLSERPSILMYIKLGGALLNIALNFILIPKYGIEGASTATLISFFCMAFSAYIINKKLIPEVNYRNPQMVLFILFILFTFIAYNIIYTNLFLVALFFITYSIIVYSALYRKNIK